jgi:hypothetical protein
MYLFLDIDGVLNSVQSSVKAQAEEQRIDALCKAEKRSPTAEEMNSVLLCPLAVSNLNDLCRKLPQLKIVISSTWRLGRTTEQLRETLASVGFAYPKQIIGKTARLGGIRGEEIKDWLQQHDPECKNFVILDDDADMGDLLPHLVQTSSYDGFLFSTLIEVLSRLREPETVAPFKSYVMLGSECVEFEVVDGQMEFRTGGLGDTAKVKARVTGQQLRELQALLRRAIRLYKDPADDQPPPLVIG